MLFIDTSGEVAILSASGMLIRVCEPNDLLYRLVELVTIFVPKSEMHFDA